MVDDKKCSMFPTEKQRVDLLSKLPEDVRLKILECLPLRDAVRTGILSRRWRYQWAKLPHIIFDEQFFYTVKRRIAQPSYISTTYSNIVNNVLFCHAGPLRNFVLFLPGCFTSTNDTNICEWLLFVSRKSISELTLVCGRYNNNKGILPSIVFVYRGLTSLKLQWFNISTLPPTFTGFQYLASLELIRCEWKSAELLESIISSCPELRLLRLCTITLLTCLTIHAPKLEHLFLEGEIDKLWLGNETTNIRTLHLDFVHSNDFSFVHAPLPVLEKLYICDLFFLRKQSELLSGEKGLIDDLQRLETRTLELIDIPLSDPSITYYALTLLNCSQPLQRLYCKVSRHDLFGLSPQLSCNLSNFEDGNLPSLKYVELVDIWGSNTELQFIKIVLGCAPVLEVMTVKLSDEKVKEAEDKLKITMKLMQFTRASRNAQIIFKI